MIQKFSVKNCLSIRDEEVLSFVANSDDTSEDIMVVNKGNTRLLKLGLIYGANASGKSNILFALNWLVRFTGGAYNPNVQEGIQFLPPFLLDEVSRTQPSEMNLIFFIGEVRYDYSLVVKDNTILLEELTRYPSGRPALVFKRGWNEYTKSSEISFGTTLKLTAKQKTMLTALAAPRVSVIAAYINNNVDRHEVFDELKHYFRQRILPTAVASTDVERFSNGMIRLIPDLKEFIIKILSLADFNISDLVIKEEKTELPDEVWTELESLSGYFDEIPDRNFTEDRLYFEHTALNFKEFLVNTLESAGTNRIYGLATYLYFLIKTNGIMLSDELESSLHYDLLRYFVTLFLLNSDEGQLICTTHSILLLDEPFVRRDCIHLCRKDATGATGVVRVSDFGLRKDVSILSAYRAGKLGGIPNLGGLML